MRRRVILHVVPAFLSAALVATPLTLDALGVAQITIEEFTLKWQWLALVAFVLFCGIVFQKWFSDYKRLLGLEGSIPTVTVAKSELDGWALVAVKNDGNYTIEASAHLNQLSGLAKDYIYDLRWHELGPGDNTGKVSIASGETKHLELAVATGMYGDNQISHNFPGIGVILPGQQHLERSRLLTLNISVFAKSDQTGLNIKHDREYDLQAELDQHNKPYWARFEEKEL